MSTTNRLLTECANIRAAEEHLEALQARLKGLNSELQNDPPNRAELDTEWVETHLAVLNLRYLIHAYTDGMLKSVLLQQPIIETHLDQCPECARRAKMRVRDITTDECPACGRSMSRFVKALVARRVTDHAS